MKRKQWKRVFCLLMLAVWLTSGCAKVPEPEETLPVVQTEEPAGSTAEPTVPTTLPQPTEETTEETTLPDVVILSEEDRELLLKIGMAEVGETECETCIALVMCTVLNRVNSPRFSNTVRGVLYTQGQFTPVETGAIKWYEPNESCFAALEMVVKGWDESQGALFYEFCEGESWHSQNLTLLAEHCNVRFYK